MPDRPHNRRSKLISEAAADWLVCIRAGDMSEQQKREYFRWLKQSPAHIREMLELVNLEQLLKETNLGGVPSMPDPVTVPGESNVVPLTPAKQRQEVPT